MKHYDLFKAKNGLISPIKNASLTRFTVLYTTIVSRITGAGVRSRIIGAERIGAAVVCSSGALVYIW